MHCFPTRHLPVPGVANHYQAGTVIHLFSLHGPHLSGQNFPGEAADSGQSPIEVSPGPKGKGTVPCGFLPSGQLCSTAAPIPSQSAPCQAACSAGFSALYSLDFPSSALRLTGRRHCHWEAEQGFSPPCPGLVAGAQARREHSVWA